MNKIHSTFHQEDDPTPLYLKMQQQWNKIYTAWKMRKIDTTRTIPKPTHFDISHAHLDSDSEALVAELCTMDPVLQRNIGIISTICNVRKLADAIETGDIIAISDAFIRTRSRAAHSYIISTKDSTCLIKGAAPVDCEIDDIESTRAETFGSIAIHTLLLALSSTFAIKSGEVAVYCDNKDALCMNQIILSEISFPRFFRPNIDAKIPI